MSDNDRHTLVSFSLLCFLKAQPISDSSNITSGLVFLGFEPFYKCEHLCSVTTCAHTAADLQLSWYAFPTAFSCSPDPSTIKVRAGSPAILLQSLQDSLVDPALQVSTAQQHREDFAQALQLLPVKDSHLRIAFAMVSSRSATHTCNGLLGLGLHWPSQPGRSVQKSCPYGGSRCRDGLRFKP